MSEIITHNLTVDPRLLRNATGCFATGVTVVTISDKEGRPLGLTANSFSSVSLNPPLVLWSLRKDSKLAPSFEEAGHFAIHVLSMDQHALAMRFASTEVDRFAGVDFTQNEEGLPLLDNCLARFECKTWNIVDGGDHLIFIGEVLALDQHDTDGQALMFWKGKFLN